jgi:hypothetical protein
MQNISVDCGKNDRLTCNERVGTGAHPTGQIAGFGERFETTPIGGQGLNVQDKTS